MKAMALPCLFADFNGDGLTDIARIDEAALGVSVSIHRSTGGSFSAPLSREIVASSAGMTVADLTGDGKAELILGNPGEGPSEHGVPSFVVTIADAAIVIADPAWQVVSRGTGTTGSGQREHSYGYRVGDFNGDGLSDVVASAFGHFSWTLPPSEAPSPRPHGQGLERLRRRDRDHLRAVVEMDERPHGVGHPDRRFGYRHRRPRRVRQRTCHHILHIRRRLATTSPSGAFSASEGDGALPCAAGETQPCATVERTYSDMLRRSAGSRRKPPQRRRRRSSAASAPPSPAMTTAPTIPSRRCRSGARSITIAAPAAATAQTVATRYSYDAYGNVIAERN